MSDLERAYAFLERGDMAGDRSEPSSVGTEVRGSGSNPGEIPDWLPIRNIVESDEIRASHRK